MCVHNLHMEEACNSSDSGDSGDSGTTFCKGKGYAEDSSVEGLLCRGLWEELSSSL